MNLLNWYCQEQKCILGEINYKLKSNNGDKYVVCTKSYIINTIHPPLLGEQPSVWISFIVLHTFSVVRRIRVLSDIWCMRAFSMKIDGN